MELAQTIRDAFSAKDLCSRCGRKRVLENGVCRSCDVTVRIHANKQSLDEFLEKTAKAGEPLFMPDPWGQMYVGVPVQFDDGTRGTITREVDRLEYFAWKDRIFPGWERDRPGIKFFEIQVD